MHSVFDSGDETRLIFSLCAARALSAARNSLRIDPSAILLGGAHDRFSGLDTWMDGTHADLVEEPPVLMSEGSPLWDGSLWYGSREPRYLGSLERGSDGDLQLLESVSAMSVYMHLVRRSLLAIPRSQSHSFDTYCKNNRKDRPNYTSCFTIRNSVFLQCMWAEDLQEQLAEHETSRTYVRAMMMLANLRLCCKRANTSVLMATSKWAAHAQRHRELLSLPAVKHLMRDPPTPRRDPMTAHLQEYSP